jgi:hypothetical protein
MADKITVLDNDYASLWYYPEKKVVHHQWKKYAYGKAFQEVLIKGTEAFEQYGGDKWLSDDRNFGAIHGDDKEWGDANWVPRVIKAGWKYWAMILPEKVIGQMSITRLTKEYSTALGIEVNIFSDPDEAMRWLESK